MYFNTASDTKTGRVLAETHSRDAQGEKLYTMLNSRSHTSTRRNGGLHSSKTKPPIRHRAPRHEVRDIMWKCIPQGTLLESLLGHPPPVPATPALLCITFFRAVFWESEKRAHGLPNGSPGDSKIDQKREKVISGRGLTKVCQNDSKFEALEPQKR